MLAPENEARVDLNSLYVKRRLTPFAERAPYADQFPALASWTIQIGERPNLTLGREAKIFEFQARSGEAARVGTMLCYEQLYGAETAEIVRAGAQFLAAQTNEGWFGSTQGQFQLAAFSRLRSIETRRETVRVGSTGISWVVDRFGRIKSQIPWQSEQTLRERIALSDEQTVYVRFPDYFSKFCALIALSILFAAVVSLRRKLTASV